MSPASYLFKLLHQARTLGVCSGTPPPNVQQPTGRAVRSDEGASEPSFGPIEKVGYVAVGAEIWLRGFGYATGRWLAGSPFGAGLDVMATGTREKSLIARPEF